MNFAGLIFLLIAHFITGRGIIELFRIKFSFLILVSLSMLVGVATFSLIPLIMGLTHMPIARDPLLIFILVVTAAAAIPLLKYLKNFALPPLKEVRWPKLYELPFLVVFGLLMCLSVWRCYYYPPNPRDMLSGPETIAEYAVREKTLINSVFSLDLTTTNNHLKPLYVTSLQIIYKIFVQPFGQLWLSILAVSFLTLVISLLKEKLHPVVALFVMVYFFGMPEVFGYTYLMLYDYSNMIFFFCGFYFLSQYFTHADRKNYFLLSVLFFSFATYIRSETFILIGMSVPLVAILLYKDKKSMVQIALKLLPYLLFPFIVYYVSIGIYDRYYIPEHYDVGTEINKNIKDVGIFFDILGDMSTKLIFNENTGAMYYGYFIQLFLLVFVVDLIFFRKNWSKEKIVAVYAIVLVYVGLAALSYVFPLVDLLHTIKRGLFKMFPLMLLYFRNSGILLKLTDILNKWEYGIKEEAPRPKPVPVGSKPPVQPMKTAPNLRKK